MKPGFSGKWRPSLPSQFYYIILLTSFVFPLDVRSDRNADNDSDSHRLVVISMDGFRWDYLNGRAKTPTFDWMKSHGVFASEGVESVFVTNTLPNHMSIVTGLYPESHGMIDNVIFDPRIKDDDTYVANFYDHDAVYDPAWYESVGEPVWISHMIQNGGKTGVLMWMGGETPIKDIRPTKFFLHTYDLDEMDEMDMLLGWLTDKDDVIDLALVYFPQPDSDGHLYGPDSIQVTRKIEYLDKALAYFIKKLEELNLLDRTDVMVVSDHGFTDVSPEKVIQLDDILDPSSYKTVTPMPSSSLGIHPDEGMLETVYAKLKTAAARTGLFQVYKAHDIPERFHYKTHRRIPPIFASARLGYSFSTRARMEGFDELKGNHGYDNKHHEMRPFFMAFGPSFKEGFSVKTFRNVDIYPLMCHLKGIHPAPNNGSLEVVSRLLRHYPDSQSKAMNQPCDLEHDHVENPDSSCPQRYIDEEIVHD